jgi:hypothetical protein
LSDPNDPPGYDSVGRTVGYTLSSQTYHYLWRLIELGAIEGPLGDMKPAGFLAPVIAALHETLAGGEVELTIKHRGNPDIVRELEELARAGAAESNAINAAAGYYVTLVP